MRIDKEIMEQMEQDREHQDYRLEKILLNFSAEICAKMEALGINRAELANRLGKSRAFVSKILGCNHNITLKTMDSISHVLGMEIKVQVHERKSIAEELAAKNRFALYKFEHPRSNRVVINKSTSTRVGASGTVEQSDSLVGLMEAGNDEYYEAS